MKTAGSGHIECLGIGVCQLAALTSEIERLRADKDVIRSQERNTAYEGDIAQLEASNEELLAALKAIAIGVSNPVAAARAAIAKLESSYVSEHGEGDGYG